MDHSVDDETARMAVDGKSLGSGYSAFDIQTVSSWSSHPRAPSCIRIGSDVDCAINLAEANARAPSCIRIGSDVDCAINFAEANVQPRPLPTEANTHFHTHGYVSQAENASIVAHSSRSHSKYMLEHSVSDPLYVQPAMATTYMIRNIPNNYSRDSLVSDLNTRGFHGKYDFFYLPIDFNNGRNFGYGFINLTNALFAAELVEKLDGKEIGSSGKLCKIAPAKVQGLVENARQYRTRVVCMEEKYHPIFFKDGERIPFPIFLWAMD